MAKKIFFWSLANAIGTVLYVFLVTLVMRNGETIFGKMNNGVGPVAFLLLFVLSTAVTATLVLGRPIWWYLAGDKKDSVKLFGATLSWLAIFLLIFIFSSILVQ